MEYIYKCCPVCGSPIIRKVTTNHIDDDITYDYICESCGEHFSSKCKRDRALERLKKVEKESTSFSAKDVYKTNISKVLSIYCTLDDSKTKTGTGFLITNNFIVTNAHIVLDENNEIVLGNDIFGKFDNDEQIYPLEFVYVSKEKDICLLHLEDERDFESVVFNNNEIETGEKVFTIGNSKGQGLAILDGIISDDKRVIKDNEYIMFTAPITNGNSGGPVFNEEGKLIGMATLGSSETISMNYAIPLEVIMNFLKDVEDKEDLVIL